MADQGVDAESIREAVDLFYERVLADADLAPLFAGIDMSALYAHQRDSSSTSSAGPTADLPRLKDCARQPDRHGPLFDGMSIT